jgi:DNA primase
VQRKDIIGAIMGQTEGLLGDELELRKLQRTARVGHVDVEIESIKGKVSGIITIPSSMDNVETAIIASSLETIDRIGPCKSIIVVDQIQDIRVTKRNDVVERAKSLLLEMVSSGESASKTVIEEVRSVLTTQQVTAFHGLTCGPNVETSDSLIIVEGRNDVKNVINFGIKNAISADGAGNIKQELIDLANAKENVTVAIDGDRGGEMLFRELFGQLKVNFVAQAPVGQEWELLPQKTVTKCLQSKVDASLFNKKLLKKEAEDDGVEPEEAEVETPARATELFAHLEGLAANKAVIVYVDGNVSDPIGPSKLAGAAEEADGAVAIVFNGPLSERQLEIASDAAIETVVGKSAGKGFKVSDDVETFLVADFE